MIHILKSDVLMLADIFEKFSKKWKKLIYKNWIKLEGRGGNDLCFF